MHYNMLQFFFSIQWKTARCPCNQIRDYRSELFKQIIKTRKRKKALHISTFNAKNPPYSKWFKDLKNILDKDPHCKKLAEQVMFVTRQSKNLQRVLTSSKVKNANIEQRPRFQEGAGSLKCSGCHACKIVQNSKFFKSTNTKRKYFIRQKIDCRSSFLVYLIFCSNCRDNYVGKTKKQFRERHSVLPRIRRPFPSCLPFRSFCRFYDLVGCDMLE